MKSTQAILIAVIIAFGVGSAVWMLNTEAPAPIDTHQEDEHENDEHADDEHVDEGERIELSAAQLENAQLKLETAGPATLEKKLRLNGMIVPNQEKLVHIVPRFPGVIRSISKSIGENVQRGELLFTIESNENLQTYEIRSPLAGTVLERESALGEFAGEGSRLMVVADLNTVWVDLRVPQRHFALLQRDQKVTIFDGPAHQIATSKITYISPFGMTDTQSMLARAVVDNAEGQLLPGIFVTCEVKMIAQTVPLAIKETAIQYLNGIAHIFISEGGGFVSRQVNIGDRDGTWVEILDGLSPGEEYVSENSFMLKAELGKGLAEHEH